MKRTPITCGAFPCYFPCYFLFFPVPDPAISADVLAGTHFFAGFGCRPAPLYRDLQAGEANGTRPNTDNALSNLLWHEADVSVTERIMPASPKAPVAIVTGAAHGIGLAIARPRRRARAQAMR